MINVGRDDGAAGGDLAAHEFRGDLHRHVGTPALAGVLFQQLRVTRVFTQLLQAHRFADRDVFHLRGDDPLARVVHLCDVLPGQRAARLADVLEAQVRQLGIRGTGTAEVAARPGKFFSVVTLKDPLLAQRCETLQQIDLRSRVGVRSGSVVDRDRRVFLHALRQRGGRLLHLAHADAQVRPRAGDIHLA